jgi:hypothetical protein
MEPEIQKIVSQQTSIEKAEANVPEPYFYTDKNGEVRQGICVVKDVDESKPGEYWWKLMLSDLLDLLEDISSKQTQALRAILAQFDPHTGIVLVSQRELAKQAGCSINTVSKVIQLMKKHNLIKMANAGTYMINPIFMSQGGKGRFDSLLIRYREIPSQNSSLSLQQKVFTQNNDGRFDSNN